MKWATSYSSMTMAEAEKRLGLRVKNIKAVPAAIMLASARNSMEADAVKETTERVYRRIVEYLKIEGYPTEANTNFKEININDLVYSISYARRDGTVCSYRERKRLFPWIFR